MARLAHRGRAISPLRFRLIVLGLLLATGGLLYISSVPLKMVYWAGERETGW